MSANLFVSTSRATLLGLAALLAGCSGGGSAGGGAPGTGGNFVVLRTTPPNNGSLTLNEPIQIDFSNRIDLSSADLNTVNFQVFDLNGNPVAEQPAGEFALERSPGDQEVGRRLVFNPRFPTNNTFSNGGFRAGRRYVVQLVGGTARNGTTLTDINGRPLLAPQTFSFETPTGTTPQELFSDTIPGGPRRTSQNGFEINVTEANGEVPLSRASTGPIEIRLRFDQPLNPNSANVPVNVTAAIETRPTLRGRIFLEYDDPELGQNVWIPALVDLEINNRLGSTVLLRPIGVLPNNATIRVIVENTVEDMSGESNVSDPAFNRIFETFETVDLFEPQFDAVFEDFGIGSTIDMEAAFLEPQAAFDNGRLSASFDFPGTETTLRFEPNTTEVILNTDFTQITPVGSPPINVSGGVFSFASVLIPDGVTVRGEGSRPMIWLVNGDFEVRGSLQVNGGVGDRVDVLMSANFPTGGGPGVCGGGAGGEGSPVSTDRSLSGEAGFGPGQQPGGGGGAGLYAIISSCARGSGGGGGSFSTEGDPYYPPNGGPRWTQVSGPGGEGCAGINNAPSRTLQGGNAGPRPFTDASDANDFFGSGLDLAAGVRLEGELLQLQGGAGGGGGGDRGTSGALGDPNFINDEKGGGGGGGGGVLVVQALGKITVGVNGEITANGGDGGGGEQAGSNERGGGGGGGSGGMIVLISAESIELGVRKRLPASLAETYEEGDNIFSLSADGGIGTQGNFANISIVGKYGSNRNSPGMPTWNNNPAGGFGGMGLIQLLTPPGNDTDGTNNRLDDNITFFEEVAGSPVAVSNNRKVELLGWRGYVDSQGMRVDEAGNPITVGTSGLDPALVTGWGDIRPSPILLPAPYGPASRARSRWIDLGNAVREIEVTTPANGEARTVVTGGESVRFGDEMLGYGTSMNGSFPGYANFDGSTGAFMPSAVDIGGQTSFAIGAVEANASFEGRAAVSIDLTGVSLGDDNRYTGYRVEVDNGGAALGDYRILGHTDTTVFLSVDGAFPASASNATILAQFFEVQVDGQPGLGGSFAPGVGSPVAVAPTSNVRVGFAFTVDPFSTDPMDRWPNASIDYEFDLTNPGLQNWIDTQVRSSVTNPTRQLFVQWDVLFNSRFDPSTPTNFRAGSLAGSATEIELPSIGELVIPYRY